MTEIELTKGVFNRLTKIFGVLKCERCGKHLKIGEPAISKKKQSNIPKALDPTAFPSKNGFWRRKFYHKQCWEALFIEIKD